MKSYFEEFPESTFCPDVCTYLSCTESEQNKVRPKSDHICLKYNVRVKHEIFHPKIMRCKMCIENKTFENEVLDDIINKASKIENVYKRVKTLSPFIPLLDGNRKDKLIEQILGIIPQIEDDYYKTDAYIDILPYIDEKKKIEVLNLEWGF